MADFCYDCTAHLFGPEFATRNEMNREGRGDYNYMDLCECCGWGYFDQAGKRIRSMDKEPVSWCDCPVHPGP